MSIRWTVFTEIPQPETIMAPNRDLAEKLAEHRYGPSFVRVQSRASLDAARQTKPPRAWRDEDETI